MGRPRLFKTNWATFELLLDEATDAVVTAFNDLTWSEFDSPPRPRKNDREILSKLSNDDLLYLSKLLLTYAGYENPSKLFMGSSAAKCFRASVVERVQPQIEALLTSHVMSKVIDKATSGKAVSDADVSDAPRRRTPRI